MFFFIINCDIKFKLIVIMFLISERAGPCEKSRWRGGEAETKAQISQIPQVLIYYVLVPPAELFAI